MKKVFYQIYALSFLDTNGSGKGDIKGIIKKLGYLKWLGVDYIWITPIFKSPFKDNGYDVADYYNVDPIFGTNKDLKKLIVAARKLDLKIMLDMVFNHTSTEHEWFKKWQAGDAAYKDFYISKYSQHKPPTNWLSKFGGSAWEEYKPNHWYLHLFNKFQADLNWDNPEVRTKIKEVLKHYINLGVKGFRFDVINLISKRAFKDDFKGDGRKYYTDGPKAHDYISEIAKEFPSDNNFLTAGELSSTSIWHATQYANNKKTELDIVFTFQHLKIDHDGINKFVDLKPNIFELNKILKEWWTKISNKGSQLANFLNNHDQPRSIFRFIHKDHWESGAKMLFALTASLPGVPYIYQGEEIGMTNVNFKKMSQYKDVETLDYLRINKFNKIPNGVLQKSRDNARTPMQWSNQKNAGFTATTPWIDINPNYKKINVKDQIKNNNSILHFYKAYIDFIKHDDIFSAGDIKFNNFSQNVISFRRKTKNKKYNFIFSFNDKIIKYHFQNKVIKSNYSVRKGVLKPYQFLVIKGD